MKKMLLLLLTGAFISSQSFAQEDEMKKEKRASPPMSVTQKIESGATITINYGQPSLKGRTIGKDVEPMEGKVWRTGANEATTIETDKDLMIEGEKLPAGKYALFTIFNGNTATVIFNEVWQQWGAFKYEASKDVLRVTTPVESDDEVAEKLTFTIEPEGDVSMNWGEKELELDIE